MECPLGVQILIGFMIVFFLLIGYWWLFVPLPTTEDEDEEDKYFGPDPEWLEMQERHREEERKEAQRRKEHREIISSAKAVKAATKELKAIAESCQKKVGEKV